MESFSAFFLAYLARLHAGAGDIDRAAELVAEALDVVYRTGEELHLPELLRQRARYALDSGGNDDEAVADLKEAVRVATEQGARVSRLRAAVELARVPASYRPDDWRSTLSEAREDMPPSFTSDETTAADRLLDQ
jgi:tetratricopeptide (TPR) repeat protein